MSFKELLVDQVKNLGGWKTSRKLVVFAVDDYGSIRLSSKESLTKMREAGVKFHNRFDLLDTLETREDLEMLFEALSSVKDQHGRHAVFTPYALPCNMNFEQMEKEGNQRYVQELLPETFAKLSDEWPEVYNNTWRVWREGISSGIMQPEFHGREHFNLAILESKLRDRDATIMTMLRSRSLLSINKSETKTKRFTAAFSFHSPNETETFPSIIESGLHAFEKVFGYKAVAFTPPAQQFPQWLEPTLTRYGIRVLDKPFYQKIHDGNDKYHRSLSFTSFNEKAGLLHQVRNVVFEPAHQRNVNWVQSTLSQIESAFRWKKPAIISSHRVNFCGLISEENRKEGITVLKELLRQITMRWPDVEFVSSKELSKIILAEV